MIPLTNVNKMRLSRRICSNCGASDEIRDDEAIWPRAWACPKCSHTIEIRDGIPIFAPTLADTVSGMDPSLFEQLAGWEDNNFWFVPRNRLITTLLDRYFPTAQNFMEVGCGNGFVLTAISGMRAWRRLVGSELHPTGLAIARNRLGDRAEFVQLDARAIPASELFDVIGAFDVLEHIEDDAAVLAAMHGAIRADGGIVLAVPQHPWLWSNTDERALHVRRYRIGELERKIQAAGFHLLFSASYTALLLPLMAASRLRGSTKSDSLRREFELPTIVNNWLRAILQLEVSLTLAGIHFPAGGSRVIVATKVDVNARRPA
jgi:SAM-dependent methyltransferase